LGATAAQEIFRAASRTSGLVDGKPLRAAARHGDFTARNILIDGERIGVVDFENFVERDTIYEDLGKFAAYLALLQGRPGYSRAAMSAAARCFLSGYGSSVDGKLVGLFALKAAVRMFAYRGKGRMANFFGFDYLYTKQLIRLGEGLTKL
jgi:Ser/Thr protein kinase RdoA (MazF antagonist)